MAGRGDTSTSTSTGNRAHPGGTGTSHAERVFRVQQAFARLGGGVHGPGELAQIAELPLSVVHRILQSGIYHGTFRRDGHGKYALGVGAAELGFRALMDGLEGDVTQTVLQDARRATDDGLVFLYMKAPFGGIGRQCIGMAVGDSDLVELGMTPRDVLSVTRSLRTGASGRTILAYLPEEVQELVFAESVPEEAGPGVFVDVRKLKQSLEVVRDRGYALGLQECMADWNSIAAPIFWEDQIQGTVLMLKPAAVMPKAPTEYIEATKQAAARLSRAAGGGWPTG